MGCDAACYVAMCCVAFAVRWGEGPPPNLRLNLAACVAFEASTAGAVFRDFHSRKVDASSGRVRPLYWAHTDGSTAREFAFRAGCDILAARGLSEGFGVF